MVSITCKVVVCGDFAVGKTTFVKLFLGGEVLTGYKATVGVDIGRAVRNIDDHQLIFQIWDLSGQQSFKSIRKQFYSRTDGAILIYDVSRRETYQNILHWVDELIESTGKIPVVLVGNKIDLREQIIDSVTTEEGYKLSELASTSVGSKIPFVEASAIKQENNLEPFISLGHSILNHHKVY